MNVYVLSFYCTELREYIYLGVYSSKEKAHTAMKATFSENESIFESESLSDRDAYFRTNKCTYHIESFTLDN
jgi:hypothetical protein